MKNNKEVQLPNQLVSATETKKLDEIGQDILATRLDIAAIKLNDDRFVIYPAYRRMLSNEITPLTILTTKGPVVPTFVLESDKQLLIQSPEIDSVESGLAEQMRGIKNLEQAKSFIIDSKFGISGGTLNFLGVRARGGMQRNVANNAGEIVPESHTTLTNMFNQIQEIRRNPAWVDLEIDNPELHQRIEGLFDNLSNFIRDNVRGDGNRTNDILLRLRERERLNYLLHIVKLELIRAI